MIGKLLPMVGRAFRMVGKPVPMCGRGLPMGGKRFPWAGKLVPRPGRTFPGAGRLVPMIANVSTEARKEGAMRGKSVPRSGRGLRKLVACHSWDGTSALTVFA